MNLSPGNCVRSSINLRNSSPSHHAECSVDNTRPPFISLRPRSPIPCFIIGSSSRLIYEFNFVYGCLSRSNLRPFMILHQKQHQFKKIISIPSLQLRALPMFPLDSSLKPFVEELPIYHELSRQQVLRSTCDHEDCEFLEGTSTKSSKIL